MVSSMIYHLLLDRVNECPGAKMLFMGDALQVRPIEQAEDVLMEHAVKVSVARHARDAGYDVDIQNPKKTIEEMIDFLLASDMENVLLGSPETRNFECGARSVMEHDAHPRWILRENFRANKDSDNSLLELANILRKHSVNPSDSLKPNHQLSAECAAEVAEFLSQRREQILKISLEDSLRDIIENPSEAFFIQDTNAKNAALNAECARRTTHLDSEVFKKTLRSGKQGLIDLVSKKTSILSPGQLLVIDDNKTVNSNIGQTKIWNGARVQVIESEMAVVQTGTQTWHTNVIVGFHGQVINSPIQDNMEVILYFEADITKNGALILKEIKPHYTADERVNPESMFAYWNHNQGKVVDNLFGRYGSKLIKDQGFHDLVDLNARVEAKWHSTKPGGFSSSWSGDPEKFWISHISSSSVGAAYGWGLTIHKAQGSEYKRVHTSYGLVTGSGVAKGFKDSALSMIYTAVTRAKEHVCLIQEDFGQYGSYKHNTPAKPLIRNNNTSSPKRTMRTLRRK